MIPIAAGIVLFIAVVAYIVIGTIVIRRRK